MKKLTGLLLSGALLVAPFAQAANECRIKITYQGNKTKYVNINVNQRKTINQSDLTRLQNLKTNTVELRIQNPTSLIHTIKLNKNQKDPALVNYIGLHVLKTAKCLSTDGQFASPAALINQFMNNKNMQFIVSKLKQVFNLSNKKIAEELKKAGVNANKIAEGIKNALNVNGKDLSKILKQVNFSPRQITEAIAKAFNKDAKQVGIWMKQAGISVDDIVKGTAQYFNKTYAAELQLLKELGIAMKPAVKAVKKFFNTKADQMAQSLKRDWNASRKAVEDALKFAGYSASQIQQALDKVFGPVVKAGKKLVKDTAQALANQYNRARKSAQETIRYIKRQRLNCGAGGCTSSRLADILKKAGYTAEQIARALKDELKLDRGQVEQALKAARFASRTINNALERVFGAVKQVAAETAEALVDQMMKQRKSAPEIAEALVRKFRLDINRVGMLLKKAGFKAEQIVEAFKRVFKVTAKVALKEMKALGFDPRTAIRAVYKVVKFSLNTLGKLMRSVGYKAKHIADVAKNVFGKSAKFAAEQLKAAGFDFTVAKKALQLARYANKEIDEALNTVYGAAAAAVKKTVSQIASEMRIARKNSIEAANAIKGELRNNLGRVLYELKKAGYLAKDIAVAALRVFRASATQTAIEMKRLGFSRLETQVAMNAAGFARGLEEALDKAFGPAINNRTSSSFNKPTGSPSTGTRNTLRPVAGSSRTPVSTNKPAQSRGAIASIQVLAKNRAEVLGKPRDRNNARPIARLTMGSVSKATPMSVLVGGANNRCGAPNSFLMKPRLVARQTFTVTRLANYPAFRTQAALNKVGSSLLYLCAQPEGGSCSCSKLP